MKCFWYQQEQPFYNVQDATLGKKMTHSNVHTEEEDTDLLSATVKTRPARVAVTENLCSGTVCTALRYTHIKNLGAFLDNTLSMEQHISHLCRSAYLAMRQTASIPRYLTEKKHCPAGVFICAVQVRLL